MLRTAILAAFLAASGTISGAQGLRNDLVDIGPPAEVPLESFEGRQYVDSRGCVYVRSGDMGEPGWVPRVTEHRKALCGFQPTQIARSAPPDPVPSTTRSRNVVVAAPASRPRAAQVATAPRLTGANTSASFAVGSQIAVRPAPEIRTPRGYRKAWDDGRLNPDRGKQTLRGALQTALVWTQEVPRRLKTPDGRDVTNTYHYLVYPYTDYDKQLEDLRGGRFITVKTPRGLQIVPKDALRRTASGRIVLSSQ